MKTRIAAIAATAVLALLLTGCGDDTTPADSAPTPDVTSATVTVEKSTPAPLVATTPKALEGEEAEAAFLATVRERLSKIRTQIPDATDEQLLDAAHEACGRIEDGESSEGMSLIDGEQKSDAGYYMDSGAIITSARLTICPPVKE